MSEAFAALHLRHQFHSGQQVENGETENVSIFFSASIGHGWLKQPLIDSGIGS
jgi:hypothetical protein